MGDAAGYTMADITMLRRELVIGYLVAGFLTVLVPMDVWNACSSTATGSGRRSRTRWSGPFIAFISFVCSIGNVPMAAALWHGGISFGGVISFIFADLIALPLVLIYRKYYGTRLTLRLFVWFYAVMAVAGLAGRRHVLASRARIPTSRARDDRARRTSSGTTRRSSTSRSLRVFAVLYWLYRQRGRGAAANGAYATDPVCGMQVEKANAPAHVVHDGRDVWFCSDAAASASWPARVA